MISSNRSSPVNLRSHHIFVTGGTGFIGKTLLDYFAECAGVHGSRFHVTVLSRSPEAFLRQFPRYSEPAWLQVIKGDLFNFPVVKRPVTDFIHAAADTHGVKDKEAWIDQIVNGTRSALGWAAGLGVRRFLFVSSGAVYGRQPSDVLRLPEDFPGAPPTTAISSVYGQAKRLAEQLCTTYQASHSLEIILARCFAFTGPHIARPGPYAIGNFMHDALLSDCIRVRGDGTAVRTYLYGRDLAHWLTTLLIYGAAGQAYNVGSDQPITMAALASMVAECVSPGKKVLIENAVLDDGGRSIYVPDIAKAAAVGLAVETSLADAIRLSLTDANAVAV